jgi:uncharacterized protein YgfB (UPF0149 family)
MVSISKKYERLYLAIWKTMLSEDKTTRISYGNQALHELEKLQDYTLKADLAVDGLAFRLAAAANEIRSLKDEKRKD